LKVLMPGRRSPWGRRFVYPEPGQATPPVEVLRMCRRGYHLCTPESLGYWYNLAKMLLRVMTTGEQPVVWLAEWVRTGPGDRPRWSRQRVLGDGCQDKSVNRCVRLIKRLRKSRRGMRTCVDVPGHGWVIVT
jgi:hypothetical protein